MDRWGRHKLELFSIIWAKSLVFSKAANFSPADNPWGRIVIKPWIFSCWQLTKSGISASNSALSQPNLSGSGTTFTCSKTWGLISNSPARRSSLWANFKLSREWIKSKDSRTLRALFACRCPIKCQEISGRSFSSCCFEIASCSLLSAKSLTPAR